MRVALISLHFAEYAMRLALALAKDHMVQIHMSDRNARSELSSSDINKLAAKVELHLHPHPTRKSALVNGWRIASTIRKFKPDVVHSQEAGDWTLACAQAFIRRFKFIYTIHDPIPHSGLDNLIMSRHNWARCWLRRRADCLIVHGIDNATKLIYSNKTNAGRIFVVQHGVLGTVGGEILEKSSPLGTRLLFFGRIEAYKGLGVLLEAIELLLARGINVPIDIVGRGSDLERHRLRIASLSDARLDERFIHPDELRTLMIQARAVILPYLDATQSGVIAMAFGSSTPVVATRVGAIPEIVTDGVNGLLIPPGSAKALAEAIVRVLTDTELVRQITLGAYISSKGPLSWTKIALETTAIYNGTTAPVF